MQKRDLRLLHLERPACKIDSCLGDGKVIISEGKETGEWENRDMQMNIVGNTLNSWFKQVFNIHCAVQINTFKKSTIYLLMVIVHHKLLMISLMFYL